jgi:hypothetical protein
MKRRKQIGILLLAGSLLLPVLISMLLQGTQLLVQWQMREALEEEQLITLELESNQVKWIHPEKECLINGNLFDVKSVSVTGNVLRMTGLYDTTEKEILDFIQQQNEKENKEQAKKIIQIVSSLVGITTSDSYLLFHPTSKLTSIYNAVNYSSPGLSITGPPPKTEIVFA